MSSVPGQPAPKPSSLKSQVPAEPKEDISLDPHELEQLKAASQIHVSPNEEAQLAQANQPPPSFPGAGVVQGAADLLPAGLGIAGGIVGGGLGLAGGPPGATAGAIGGAAAGGAAGSYYRDMIEKHILGKQVDEDTVVGNAGTAALTEGAGQAIGMGAAKLGGKAIGLAAKTELGQAAAEVASGPLSYIKTTLQAAKDKIEEPLTKFIASRTSTLTPEAAGDAAKELLKNNINQKYGTFVKAYQDLDGVAKTLPIADETRRTFTMGLKEWGAESHSGDNWRTIKKFTDDIDAAGTGKQLESVLGQIRDAKEIAFRNGATAQGQMLKELQTKTTDFLEGQTTKLAQRIQAGKATPQEMQFLDGLVQSRGIQEARPQDYAKSLANDYLKSKDKVRVDYAGFRNFLEDVGEQTKVKADKLGPMNFLNAIDDVPSEKLIERMFDPKNANALRTMQKETPEVFDQVIKAKMNQIVQKSSPNGVLDLKSFQKTIHALPPDTRRLLMSAEDMATMNKVVSNPRLQTLAKISDHAHSGIMKYATDIAEVARTIGGDVAQRAVNSPRLMSAAQNVAGQKPAAMLVNALGPKPGSQ